MSRGHRDQDLRVKGMGMRSRFTLSMSLALTAVMAVFGFVLYTSATNLAQAQQERTVLDAVKILAEVRDLEREERRERERAAADGREYEPRKPEYFLQAKENAKEFDGGRIKRWEIVYGKDRKPGYLYRIEGRADLIVPERLEQTGQSMFGLIIAMILLVIGAGAVVAFIVSNRTASPLEDLVDDIRQISHGNLQHRTRVRAGGEVALLARSVNRMAANLGEAQEAELEFLSRERELAVAGEVREALLPVATPLIEGYDVGSIHIGAPEPGGDFHDFIEHEDGRLGLLVCGVSGRGIPGALIGAIARSYLRVELAADQDLYDALKRVNRMLAQDVRRGMFVTALYALVDPQTGHALVACAGHKVALIRYSAEDKKIRLVQPEGIALGFDKGPVFDRTLEIVKVPMEPGDRLLMCNEGPVQVQNPDGEELGEKAFYRQVLKFGGLPTDQALKSLKRSLAAYADETPYPNDLSIVTISRDGGPV